MYKSKSNHKTVCQYVKVIRNGRFRKTMYVFFFFCKKGQVTQIYGKDMTVD